MFVEDLIVENREIEGKTKMDWVCRRHVLFADCMGLFVSFSWSFYGFWKTIAVQESLEIYLV